MTTIHNPLPSKEPSWENSLPRSEAMKCSPNIGFGFWGDEITAKFFDPTLEYTHTDPKTGPVFVSKKPALDRDAFPFGTRTAAKVPESTEIDLTEIDCDPMYCD